MKMLAARSFLTILISVVAGCALGPTGLAGSPADAKITIEIKERLAHEPALQAPNQIYVQTLHGVVYLSGLVDTPFERAMAESLARQVPGVARVASTIGLAGNEH